MPPSAQALDPRPDDPPSTARALARPERLAALERTGLLARLPGEALDRLTRLAVAMLRVPGAAVNVVTADEQLTVSCAGALAGVPGQRHPAVETYCQHEVRTGRPLVVPDTQRHPLVCESRWTREGGLRAYAGVPVVAADGEVLGSFCVFDVVPRAWTAAELAMLDDLAAAATSELRWRDALRTRERAVADAEAANRSKLEFLAHMSHELRTPLNAIAGYVQLLDMELYGPVTAAQREVLGRVDRAERHLLGLITDVLSFSKLEAGKVEFDVRETRVADVVRDVLPLVEPQLAAKRLALTLALANDAGATVVWADREKLAQALLNLLANAVKFTPSLQHDGSPGRVTIDCVERAGMPETVYLRVRDTGIGIPRARQATIFDPFVQVRTAVARQHEGTGLGLAISRDLLRGMGGDLRVRSVEGEGSTFTIALRRAVSHDGRPIDRRTPSDRRRAPDRRRGAPRRRAGADEPRGAPPAAPPPDTPLQ